MRHDWKFDTLQSIAAPLSVSVASVQSLGMIARVRKLLGRVAGVAATILALVAFSAFHARRVCDEIIEAEFAPPPRHSTRFVLYPGHHMDSVEPGLKAGWVVSYLPESQNYGTAFFVSLSGKVQARGTPAIVTATRKMADEEIEKFRKAFAQVDTAVQVGTSFSNVVALLGQPIIAFTNQNGTIEAHYDYMPEAMLHTAVDLTNGFTLVVSNGVIVRKGHSYTSSR